MTTLIIWAIICLLSGGYSFVSWVQGKKVSMALGLVVVVIGLMFAIPAALDLATSTIDHGLDNVFDRIKY
jgi:hypothetical protein